ncbi:glycosyltransferase [Kutzneria sp. NPDC052558]|uniref:glycosyltransferase n=1 Tax=Kutzneria sp. NPDC052558 TaxID=3364121 RepID=UPI0037CA3491
MRVLLVVPPLTGHVTPLRAVAVSLTAAGHTIAWCGPQPALSKLTGVSLFPSPHSAPIPVFPAGSSDPFDVEQRPSELRGFAALRFLWQSYLIPLADSMAPGVRAAVERFAPDVILTDQQALAGALAAKALGVPWATSATTPSELTDPLRGLPKVADWVLQLQHDLCDRHGVAPSDLRFSPHLILAFTTRELSGPPAADLPVRYVGATTSAASTVDFDGRLLDGRPLVIVTLGTSNAQAGIRFLSECNDALAAMPAVQGLIVDPTGLLPGGPVLTAERIPQVDLLARTSVLVCHGGHNTVCESLSAGVPMVLAPIRDDQSAVAQCVVAAGAGVRLRFDRALAEHVRQAVDTVLHTPGYTAAATRLGHALASAGGAEAAVRLLESLAPATEGGQPCPPTQIGI